MEATNHNRVGLRAFELLKPFYVRKLKERNTCACRYHCEMAQLRQGWNNMRTATKGIHGRNCTCQCEVCVSPQTAESTGEDQPSRCHADLSHFSGLTDLWHSVLCPLEGDGWHAPSCIKGDCEQCGVDMLMLCPREMDSEGSLKVQWHNFESVVHGRTRQVRRTKYCV